MLKKFNFKQLLIIAGGGLLFIIIIFVAFFPSSAPPESTTTTLPTLTNVVAESDLLPVSNETKKVLQRALDFDTSLQMYATGVMSADSVSQIVFAPNVSATAKEQYLAALSSVYSTGYEYVGGLGVISLDPLLVQKLFVLDAATHAVALHLYAFNNCLTSDTTCQLLAAQSEVGILENLPAPANYEDYVTAEQRALEEATFIPIDETPPAAPKFTNVAR